MYIHFGHVQESEGFIDESVVLQLERSSLEDIAVAYARFQSSDLLFIRIRPTLS